MDPNSGGPQDHGHDGAGARDGATGHDGTRGDARRHEPREASAPEYAHHAPALARTVRVVTGEYLLTVNPVDGSEVGACPPGERPDAPRKYSAAERTALDRAARPPVPPGPPGTVAPLLQRQDEREQLVRFLARGRSVRLTGPGGSGRSRLLDLVADDCADLAPDGVVRLDGRHRTADDLLHDLFHAVHHAPLHRPGRDELLGFVRETGAVVVIDNIEFGGAALDALLEATPECAVLMAATPDVPAPSEDSGVEEVPLPGLDRAAGLDLLERVLGRSVTEDESNWAGDLWFESEGLPLRFVQAGALLRQRDRLRADTAAADEYGGVFGDARSDDMHVWPGAGDEILLPALGEAAAPAPLLASRLSDAAREALRFAVALGGEVPHPSHLPALVGDTHADAALGELMSCGLLSPAGSRYRLAAGVRTQLEAAGFDDDAESRARTVARHYAWWAGHPSVTPQRVCVESGAILAALGVLAPLAPDGDDGSVAVRLARTAAPAFAAGLDWGAWERALRSGAEAARLAGDVAEQAYFHHELGVLALCGGHYDRARAELEASIGLRGALSDRRGAVAGRRALALVTDLSGVPSGFPGPKEWAGEGVPAGDRRDESSPCGVPGTFAPPGPAARGPLPTAAPRTGAGTRGGPRGHAGPGRTGAIRNFARRNLVAGGAGALLVAVLGTVVTLGATSGDDGEHPADNGGVNPTTSQDFGDGTLADTPENAGDTGEATSRPPEPGPDGAPGTAGGPKPAGPPPESKAPEVTKSPSRTASPSKSPTKRPTRTASPTKPSSPSPSPSESETPTESPSPSESETAVSPSSSDTAGEPGSASPTPSAGDGSGEPGSATPSA